MRTIIIIALVIIALVLIGLAVKVDLRLSSGPYDPESEARAAVIAEMGIKATAQALEHEKNLAAIREREANEAAALGMATRRNLAGIATITAGGVAGLALGALAGVIVWLAVEVIRRSRTPEALTIAPHIAIIRDPGGSLRVLDVLTGANFALANDRQPDKLRAENLARIEISANMTQAQGVEVIPAIRAELPQEVSEHENL